MDTASNRPWAIQPEWLARIEAAANLNLSREALAARAGRPLDGAPRVSVRDGVAVLSLRGPIFAHEGMLAEIIDFLFGATILDRLAKDLTAALDARDVSAVVLSVDSPGGEVDQVGEFAALLRSAGKPITAYVTGLGASAAYWIASAAAEVVAAPSAMLGSIGVVAVVRDTRERDARQGIIDWEFVSSQSPNKRPDPATEAGKAEFQRLVDDTAAVFVRDVAGYRGVSEATVLERYGGGSLLVGQAAVDAGLADRLGSFEALVADLGTRAAPGTAGIWGSGTGAPRQARREGDSMSEPTTQAGEQTWLSRLLAGFNRPGEEPTPEQVGQQLRAALDERDEARRELGAAQASLGKACSSMAAEFMAQAVRAGNGGETMQALADGLAARGEYEQLRGMRDEQRTRADATLPPAGLSADPKAATKPPEGEGPDYGAEVGARLERRNGKRVAVARNGQGGK